MTAAAPTTFRLPSGAEMPRLGLGTWHMAERSGAEVAEVAALRAGLDLGLRLLDTAEMYANGAAERLVAEAVAGRRDAAFLVTTVLPYHADRAGVVAACERSLNNLATDRIDLYLLHWPGSIPLTETLEAFDRLQIAGKIVDYGVSNFDHDELAEVMRLAPGRIATNQIYYNLAERAADSGLVDACLAGDVSVMAYSPIDEGRLVRHSGLVTLADRLGVAPVTLAVAWTLRRPGLASIPKTGQPDRVPALAAAASLPLDQATLDALDRLFPPPTARRRLPII